jgi:hypothetical protein
LVVHHLCAEVRERSLVLVGAFFTPGPVETELDGTRVERFAILKPDALAQIECIGLEVGGNFPFLGQQRCDASVTVDFGECLENVVQRDLGDRRGRAAGRIEAWCRFERHPQNHGVLPGLRLDGKRRRRKSGAGNGSGEYGAASDHGQVPFKDGLKCRVLA